MRLTLNFTCGPEWGCFGRGVGMFGLEGFEVTMVIRARLTRVCLVVVLLFLILLLSSSMLFCYISFSSLQWLSSVKK